MTYITVIISLTLIFHSCKNAGDDASGNEHNPDSLSPVQPVVPKNSIPAVAPPKRGLAPGQARVEGTIMAILPDSGDSRRTLRLHIRSILGYGSSAPPVPTGDTLEIPLDENPGSLKKGAVVRVLLQHNISFQEGNDDPAWSLINIEK